MNYDTNDTGYNPYNSPDSGFGQQIPSRRRGGSSNSNSSAKRKNRKRRYSGSYQDVPFFSFDGRIGRIRALYYQIIIGIPLMFICLGSLKYRVPFYEWIIHLMSIFSSIYCLSIYARRIHDLGYSSKVYIYFYILVNILFFLMGGRIIRSELIFYCIITIGALFKIWIVFFPGVKDKNRFGNPPKPSNVLMQIAVGVFVVVVPIFVVATKGLDTYIRHNY